MAPDLPGERTAEVLRQERADGLVHEPGGATADLPSMSWPELLAGAVSGHSGGEPMVRQSLPEARLVGAAPRPGPARPPRPGRMFVLTSGTTGVPRSVSRPLPLSMLLGPVTTTWR